MKGMAVIIKLETYRNASASSTVVSVSMVVAHATTIKRPDWHSQWVPGTQRVC